jgi:Green fluorescent protein
MKYTAILKGIINGQEILVQGNGTIFEGETKGNYSLDKIPLNFQPQILKGLLITGYPNACYSNDGSQNIFKGKSYTYQRKLNFNNGGVIEMSADCQLNNDILTSVFTVTGNIIADETICNSEPIIEVWQPTKENDLSGLFRITWKTDEGNYLSADAHSIYQPSGVTQDLPILHRYIEISSVVEGDKLSLLQNSRLFHKLNS